MAWCACGCEYSVLFLCDRLYENQSYLHLKFDLILSLSNLITLFPNIVLYLSKFHHIATQNFLRNSIKLTDIIQGRTQNLMWVGSFQEKVDLFDGAHKARGVWGHAPPGKF